MCQLTGGRSFLEFALNRGNGLTCCAYQKGREIVTGFSIALLVHLLSLLLATAAASLATYGALQLRAAGSAAEVMRWLALIDNIVPAFPVATLGLFASGAYLAETSSVWSAPWIIAAIAGLIAIAVLGGGVEASRARILKRELQGHGFSERARRLLRDPIAWSAKLMILTLMLGVTFVMTIKPSAAASAGALLTASGIELLAAIPFWRQPHSLPEVSESMPTA
jgi:hypothetical protein